MLAAGNAGQPCHDAGQHNDALEFLEPAGARRNFQMATKVCMLAAIRVSKTCHGWLAGVANKPTRCMGYDSLVAGCTGGSVLPTPQSSDHLCCHSNPPAELWHIRLQMLLISPHLYCWQHSVRHIKVMYFKFTSL